MFKKICIGLILGCALIGCKSEKIIVIDGGSATSNTSSLGAFNDENYVWEGWSFSTNNVENLK